MFQKDNILHTLHLNKIVSRADAPVLLNCHKFGTPSLSLNNKKPNPLKCTHSIIQILHLNNIISVETQDTCPFSNTYV